jgi:hypothetical protein
MADYKTDADWFERDRQYTENLRLLSECYGVGVDDVMKEIRGTGGQLERNGVIKRLPTAYDFQDRTLTDPELAELVLQKISAWDTLEDGIDLPDLFAQ